MLASYKHMPKTSEDGDPAQYHPLTHAVYWRMAATAYRGALAAHGPDRVMLVRFEDMIATPKDVLTRLAAFLDTPMAEEVRLPERGNTSFPAGRKTLTGLEQRLVAAITGRARQDLGFAVPDPVGFGAADLSDLLATSARAAGYRLRSLRRRG